MTSLPPGRPASILLVEDDVDQCRALAMILRAQGHVVRTVGSGDDAVAVARAQPPDLVILDVNLPPGMDGFETCRRLRELGDPSPSVLFLSACTSLSFTIRGLDLGGVDYLAKPIDPDHFAARVRAAIRTRRELDTLRDRAALDPLTGLLNRRELDARGEQLVAAATRYVRGFCCLLLDVDQFKNINDALGHVVGDQVLVRVAQLLSDTCRKSDSVFRIGGDEFLVLTPETDATTALGLGRRLVRALRRHPVLPAGTGDVRAPRLVTLSIGVAAWSRGQTLDEVVQAADRAMYEAKAHGRNGVMSNRLPAAQDDGREGRDGLADG